MILVRPNRRRIDEEFLRQRANRSRTSSDFAWHWANIKKRRFETHPASRRSFSDRREAGDSGRPATRNCLSRRGAASARNADATHHFSRLANSSAVKYSGKCRCCRSCRFSTTGRSRSSGLMVFPGKCTRSHVHLMQQLALLLLKFRQCAAATRGMFLQQLRPVF